MNILKIRYLIACMMVALLGYGSQAIAVDASAVTTVTLSFSSGHEWMTFSKDPGDTASSQGKNSIGPAAALCLYNSSCGGGQPNLSLIPSASWIWSPNVTGNTAPAEFATFFFSKTFILSAQPISGVIYIAADDFAQISVNGSVVGSIGSTTDIGLAVDANSYLHEFDISSFLKMGRNVITIQGQNGSPYFGGCTSPCTYSQNPAGVVFGGSLSFARQHRENKNLVSK